MSVLIPALNEEDAIGAVIDEIPRPPVSEILVVDNGSSDRTADVARERGARVVREERRGYGSACLRGLAEIPGTDIVVFRDGAHSASPAELPALLA
ncbi:MAG: glycosyltransferase family 2 protein, partial [Armatimonadota bacterium]